MSSNMSPQDKEAFYGQLDLLDAALEGDDDELSDDFRRQSRSLFAKAKSGKGDHRQSQANNTNASTTTKDIATAVPTSTSTPDPSRSRSSTHPAPVANFTATVVETTPVTSQSAGQTNRPRTRTSTSFVQDTPLQGPHPHGANLRRALTHPAVNTQEQSSSKMSISTGLKVSRTAKGKKKAQVVPEELRVLNGLSFFYIPPYRVKGALRAQQMERAERYGAAVTDNILSATHVVVDKTLKYDDIKDDIAAVVGKDKPVIVTDQWPIDSIWKGRLIPYQLKYRVGRMPSTLPVGSAQQAEQPVTQPSDASLKVKAPAKSTNAPRQTPSQSQVSSIRSMGIEDVGVMVPQPSEKAQASQILQRIGSEFGDELSQVMDEVRLEFKDVPRIGEEDSDLKPSENGGHGGHGGVEDSDTDDEPERDRPKKKPKKKSFHEYFACSKGGTKDQTSDQENPNAPTIAVFKQMLKYYTETNDYWRIGAYRKCINTLSRITDHKVTTAKEAEDLPCFGPRLSAKLEEIVETQTLARLNYVQNDPQSRVLALFLGVYGAGITTAKMWINKGFKSLDDLRQRADLTFGQQIGVEHYEDLNNRIPRVEVAKLGEYVKKEAAKIDQGVEFLIGGSYRRGADSSGDIDFIVTKQGTTSSSDLNPFLDNLVGNLERQGFLTAALAAHTSHKGDGGSKWHGCCVLPRITGFNDDDSYRPVWRRIDFLLVPETEFGAALIYFTGNDLFNRSLRLLASRKGMRLNQRGLYKDVLRGHNREKITQGELVEGRSERKIFQILGVEWREPDQRWC